MEEDRDTEVNEAEEAAITDEVRERLHTAAKEGHLINDAFNAYASTVLDRIAPDRSDETNEVAKQAFYAGAAEFLAIQQFVLDPSTGEATEADMEFMEGAYGEITNTHGRAVYTAITGEDNTPKEHSNL